MAGYPVAKVLGILHLLMLAIIIVILLCALFPWFVLIVPRLLVPTWV